MVEHTALKPLRTGIQNSQPIIFEAPISVSPPLELLTDSVKPLGSSISEPTFKVIYDLFTPGHESFSKCFEFWNLGMSKCIKKVYQASTGFRSSLTAI